jgi:hypothetical protein
MQPHMTCISQILMTSHLQDVDQSLPGGAIGSF